MRNNKFFIAIAFIISHPLMLLSFPGVVAGQQQSINQYAVKCLCGVVPPPLSSIKNPPQPQMAPGEYYTAINIHNPDSSFVIFYHKIAIANPVSQRGADFVTGFIADTLAPDGALEIDCNDVKQELLQYKISPAFVKGYVVVEAQYPHELDVVGVYTASQATNGPVQTSDIERVPVRRISGSWPPHK